MRCLPLVGPPKGGFQIIKTKFLLHVTSPAWPCPAKPCPDRPDEKLKIAWWKLCKLECYPNKQTQKHSKKQTPKKNVLTSERPNKQMPRMPNQTNAQTNKHQNKQTPKQTNYQTNKRQNKRTPKQMTPKQMNIKKKLKKN